MTRHELATRDLTLRYGRTTIIDALALSLPAGRVTAIVGPNGCGKSTLLAGLARLHAPSQGAVVLDGQDIQQLPARELARRLALLPQEASAPEGLTVAELVRFGRQPHQGWLRQWSAE
ncbi:MAG: ABC transporter ATP-binding protein, partial [Billgrantia desiderata]